MYCVLGIMRTVGQTVTARTSQAPSAQGQALENRNQLLFKWREACNKGHMMKRQIYPSRVNFGGPRPTQLASELESYSVQSPRMYSNTHQTAEKHHSIPDLYTSIYIYMLRFSIHLYIHLYTSIYIYTHAIVNSFISLEVPLHPLTNARRSASAESAHSANAEGGADQPTIAHFLSAIDQIDLSSEIRKELRCIQSVVGFV